MINSLFTMGLVCASCMPYNAPTPTYTIDNQSNVSVRATNLATDEEYIIQPYTQFNTILKLDSFAIDNNFNDSYYFAFSCDGSNSRWFKQDIDASNNLYYQPLRTDNKITLRNATYNNDFYYDGSLLNTEPFSDDFYFLTGLNASNYSSLGSGQLVRDVTLGTGSFNLDWNNYVTAPSGWHVTFQKIMARYVVKLRNGVYKPENVQVYLSLLAMTTGTSKKALCFGGNYAPTDFETLNVTLDNATYSVYLPSDYDNLGYFRAFNGFSYRFVNSSVEVANDNQARFYSYKTLIPVSQVDAETKDVLTNVFSMLTMALGVIFPFMSVMVFPGVTIGLLIMVPLFITLIIAIFKLIKK